MKITTLFDTETREIIALIFHTDSTTEDIQNIIWDVKGKYHDNSSNYLSEMVKDNLPEDCLFMYLKDVDGTVFM